MTKPKPNLIKKGDEVTLKGKGTFQISTVVKYCKKYGVFLLSSPLTNNLGTFWTWEPEQLTNKVYHKLIRRF